MLAAVARANTQSSNRNNAAAGTQDSVKVIRKPKGEGGDGKRGYNLQRAIGLWGKDAEYNEFLAIMRQNRRRAGIDLKKTYRENNDEAKDRLGKLVFKELNALRAYKNFTKETFPNYWPVRAALKQSLRNLRKKKHSPTGTGSDGDDDGNNDQGATPRVLNDSGSDHEQAGQTIEEDKDDGHEQVEQEEEQCQQEDEVDVEAEDGEVDQ
ncbi:hypothetical protein PQX77_017072 [Marasmius sp. AFHP31]|nr:hypothetical protein PQX77_017072 [Marasmius sp. AFHP31]